MTVSPKNRRLAIAEEVTYGTPVAVTEDMGYLQEITPSATSDVKEIHTIGNILSQQVVNLSSIPKVDVSVIMQHSRALKYLLGDVLTETTTGSDTSHTWAAAGLEATPPSMTMEIADVGATTFTRTYAGGVMSSATIGLTKEGLLTMKSSMLFKDVALSSSATAQVISSLKPLESFQGAFKIGGSAQVYTQNFEFTLDRKAVTLQQVGSRVPVSQHLQELSISAKATLSFESNAQYQNFLGGTTGISTTEPTGLTIDLMADNGTALGSGQRNMNLNLTNCQFSEISDPTTLGDIIFVDVTFTGKFNTYAYIDNTATYN